VDGTWPFFKKKLSLILVLVNALAAQILDDNERESVDISIYLQVEISIRLLSIMPCRDKIKELLNRLSCGTKN